jgi:hypothetical protein
MPKGETGGAFEQLARRCHDRAGRAAPTIRKVLDCEAADWLAFAERRRARRLQVFRAGFEPAHDTRWTDQPVLRAERRAN